MVKVNVKTISRKERLRKDLEYERNRKREDELERKIIRFFYDYIPDPFSISKETMWSGGYNLGDSYKIVLRIPKKSFWGEDKIDVLFWIHIYPEKNQVILSPIGTPLDEHVEIMVEFLEEMEKDLGIKATIK